MKSNILIFNFILILASCLEINAQKVVKYLWSGALTPHSIKVNAKILFPSDSVRLMVSTHPNFSDSLMGNYTSVDSYTNLMVSLSIDSLVPGIKYYYAVEVNGIQSTELNPTGSFITPLNGPQSFSFIFNSCNRNGKHKAYDRMLDHHPLFYISPGDLHYGNPNSANIDIHRNLYEAAVLHKFRIANFLRQTPIAYVWDDHDFCGNGSDSTFIGKDNARQAYREYVPHYPLVESGLHSPIYQSFTIGRVHFILTDLRSTKSSASMMSPEQHQWLKNQFIYARDQKLIAAWVCSMPWNTQLSSENWAAYPTQRKELSEFLRDNKIRNMFMILGDAHTIAIDDGSHSSFAANPPNPYRYPLFHAAPVQKGSSVKGGIFSQGIYPSPNVFNGQFGLVNVSDQGGDTICFTFDGIRVDSSGSSEQVVCSYSFCRTFSDPPEDEDQLDPLVIPNPTDGNFTLLFLNEQSDLILTVFNPLGKKIYETGFKKKSRKFEAKIPFTVSGEYIVHVSSNTGTFSKSVVMIK